MEFVIVAKLKMNKSPKMKNNIAYLQALTGGFDGGAFLVTNLAYGSLAKAYSRTFGHTLFQERYWT